MSVLTGSGVRNRPNNGAPEERFRLNSFWYLLAASSPVPDALDDPAFRDHAQTGGHFGARHCAAIVAVAEQAMGLAIAPEHEPTLQSKSDGE